MLGETVSHYRITRQLGAGGMGLVYEAQDLDLQRPVALKFLPPELTRDPAAKARFVQEARAASALEHPNICNVHEIAETDDGRLFIAMARYEGETLKVRIARGPLPITEILDIVGQIAAGLARAHRRGIVHRDIKPANILLADDGFVKILDFGLAKLTDQTRLTQTGTTVGTVAYMSPEQARGGEVGPAADIWSLGVVCHEMITGRLPFRGHRAEALLYAILNVDPDAAGELRPDMPPRLAELVDRCLEKDPQRRYPDAQGLLAALETLTTELAAGIRSRRALSFRRLRRRRPFRWTVAAGIVLVSAAVVLRPVLMPPRAIEALAVLPLANLSGGPALRRPAGPARSALGRIAVAGGGAERGGPTDRPSLRAATLRATSPAPSC